MTVIRAGELNKRIEILRRVETGRDGLNNPVFEWRRIMQPFAKVTYVSDGERFRAKEEAAEVVIRFLIRRCGPGPNSPNPVDVVVYRGRQFNIWGVKEVLNDTGLEISATARAE